MEEDSQKPPDSSSLLPSKGAPGLHLWSALSPQPKEKEQISETDGLCLLQALSTAPYWEQGPSFLTEAQTVLNGFSFAPGT